MIVLYNSTFCFVFFFETEFLCVNLGVLELTLCILQILLCVCVKNEPQVCC